MIDNEKAFGDNYDITAEKFDKKYSIIPTLLDLINRKGSGTCIDVGCGSGTITREIKDLGIDVIGIDKIRSQVKKAKLIGPKSISYLVADMQSFRYPKVGRICAPFVPNYINSKDLSKLMKRWYNALEGPHHTATCLVMTLDTPKNEVSSNQKFGAWKKIKKYIDDEKIEVRLYTRGKKVSEFETYFHHPITVKKNLEEIGFTTVEFCNPIFSEEGIKKTNELLRWEYIHRCDLTYVLAVKKIRK